MSCVSSQADCGSARLTPDSPTATRLVRVGDWSSDVDLSQPQIDFSNQLPALLLISTYLLVAFCRPLVDALQVTYWTI